MVLSIPVGIIFTKTQYGSGGLEMLGNLIDYFFSGTKLTGLFFMWPLAVLLELPIILSIIFPLAIVFVKFKFGYFTTMETIFCVLGAISALMVFYMKKRGQFNWFRKKDEQIINSPVDNKNHIPTVVSNFSIAAWVVFLTFFLSYYTGHYILIHLNDYFVYTGGSWIGLDKSTMEFLTGLPVTYAFLIGFLFTLFSKTKSWNSHLLALTPSLLLSGIGGVIWLFWTVTFFVIGFLTAKLLNKISTAEGRRKVMGYIAIVAILASGIYAFNWYLNRDVLKVVNYQCAATEKFKVKFYDDYIMLEKFNSNPVRLNYSLQSGSWTKYMTSNEVMTLWINGDKAYTTQNGQKNPTPHYRDCVEN